MEKISGVYKITNILTGDFYIGSSKSINDRWRCHRSPANWKRWHNLRLYQDMSRLGRDNFTLETIEEIDNLYEREQYWIDILKPSYNSNRVKGLDSERRKKYLESHHDEFLAKSKAGHQAHRDEYLARRRTRYQEHRDEVISRNKAYGNRSCLYKGETLTLNALSQRFKKQGILHPTIEAKNYLIKGEIKDD